MRKPLGLKENKRKKLEKNKEKRIQIGKNILPLMHVHVLQKEKSAKQKRHASPYI